MTEHNINQIVFSTLEGTDDSHHRERYSVEPNWSSSIMNEAIPIYGILHQGREMFNCLKFLQSKQLTGFIEIGSANGASFHCWAKVISTGPKISVDLNYGHRVGLEIPDVNTTDNVLASGEASFAVVKTRNNNWRKYFSDVCAIEGNSLATETIETMRSTLNGVKVDWLFIDACHEYSAVTADLKNYSPFVNSNGYIGFHDIQLNDEMIKFWSELKDTCKNYIEIADGNGIGIIPKSDIEL